MTHEQREQQKLILEDLFNIACEFHLLVFRDRHAALEGLWSCFNEAGMIAWQNPSVEAYDLELVIRKMIRTAEKVAA